MIHSPHMVQPATAQATRRIGDRAARRASRNVSHLMDSDESVGIPGPARRQLVGAHDSTSEAADVMSSM